eukprot:56800_1
MTLKSSIKFIINIIILSFICNSACNYAPIQLPQRMCCQETSYYNITNTVYLFGGLDERNNAINITFKWNMSQPNSTFEAIDSTPIRIASCTDSSVVIKELVYFHQPLITDGAHIFNMQTESWVIDSLIPPLPFAMSEGCLTTNNTHLFYVGGTDANQIPMNSTHILDLDSKTWESHQMTSPPINNGVAWNYCSFALSTNTLYTAGGYVSDTIHRINSIFKFDGFVWHNVTQKSVASDAGSAVFSSTEDKIYLIGGWDPDISYPTNTFYDIIDVLDVKSDSIIWTDHLSRGVSCFSSLIIRDKLFVFGGYTNFGNVSSFVQVCDLPIYPTASPTNQPSTNPTTFTSDPSSMPTTSPSSNPSTDPSTIDPTGIPTTIPSSLNPTAPIKPSECINCRLKADTTCFDGTHPYRNSEDSVWCEPCPGNTAGIDGICTECPSDTEPNHNKDDCVETQLKTIWTEIVIAIVVALVLSALGIVVSYFKKWLCFTNKNTETKVEMSTN